ncbi:hypothetical protein INT43_006897 [Umbelopsis isabellina]|uniref:Uncharacterized protein n=1 Tax=Mortierella isabellina TaxID=91625 RepID=A0A8H7UHJ6_MORIS|nr:hypothetical protein INT43_006897 [Umbelopsis isabellina]
MMIDINSHQKPSCADIAQKIVANTPSADDNAAKSALAIFHQRRIPVNSTTDYIANYCVQFVIRSDYTSSFLSECCIARLQVIDANPTKPLDPNFPSDKLDDVKQIFAKRVANIVVNTKHDVVSELRQRRTNKVEKGKKVKRQQKKTKAEPSGRNTRLIGEDEEK